MLAIRTCFGEGALAVLVAVAVAETEAVGFELSLLQELIPTAKKADNNKTDSCFFTKNNL